MTWNWIKAEVLGFYAIIAWLAPAAVPMPRLLQGLLQCSALPCAIALVPLSKRLALEESIAQAQEALDLHLLQKEMALAAAQQEEALEAQYLPEDDLHPEVTEHRQKELESLADGHSEESTNPLQISPQLAAAVRKLAEAGVSKTHIIEEILGMKGRNYKQGAQLLESLLSTAGETNADQN